VRSRKRLSKAEEESETPERLSTSVPELEPGAPTDLELMAGIQAEDPEALSKLYDRYNGIIKALILRVIHNEAEADDLYGDLEPGEKLLRAKG